MYLLRHLVGNFSQLTKCGLSSHTLLLSLTLKILPISQYQRAKYLGSSAATLVKNEVFSEKESPPVLDIEEERQKTAIEENVRIEFEGISLERGSVDVEEVVEILRREKGQDIIVLQVPAEYNYADYKVIVTGRSYRHMFIMADLLRRLCKKKGFGGRIPQIEGRNSKTWMAVDFGNIILHIFSAAGRQQYDLEMLWSVGKDYDSNFNSKNTTVLDVSDYKENLISLYPNN